METNQLSTMSRLTNTVSLACAMVLAACAVGEDYEAPSLNVAPQWKTVTGDQSVGTKSTMPWWQRFNDDILSQLAQKALANNKDLKIAEARIAEARANERGISASLWPQINATGSVSRQTVNVVAGKAVDTLSQAGVQGGWEIDVFGGNRRRSEAAAASAEAMEAERNQTRLLLLAEVARNYVALRSSQQQYAITLKNLETQYNTLEVTQGQREENDNTELEVVRAQAQVDATLARLPSIRAAVMVARNRLDVLTGGEAALQELMEDSVPIPSVPKQQVIATPVHAIARRPDIQAAERRLAAATALSGAAFAQLFPRLTLEGFFAAQHSNLYAPLSPWSATLNGLFPLLDFGRLRAQMDAADARQQQALLQYQQTILLAVEETENALAAYVNEQERMKRLAAVALEQAKAAEIAREQYKAGIATQLDLLIAESNQLDAENALVLSEASVAQNLILLYRTLAESW